MIQIHDLVFRYGSQGFTLRIEDLEIPQGQKLALVGPSGSGKTTFLNLLAGIHLPEQGSIEIHGLETTRLNEKDRRNMRSARFGLVFQEFELVEYLSVTDNIRLPFMINRTLDSQVADRAAIRALAESVGIGDKLKRMPQQLSQGEKQRVAICRALIHQPDILLADEPTGNLDPANKGKILKLLIEQAERQSATLIVVTHDQSLLDRFERVIDFAEFGA